MQTERDVGKAPRTKALAEEIANLRGCVGCTECQGLCQPLIDAVLLPDMILSRVKADE